MRHFLHALARSRSGLIGMALIVLFVAAAVLAPLLDLPNPLRGDLKARLAPPTWTGLFAPGAHPLGTDQLGRYILSRIIFGSQITLTVAAYAVVLGGIVGVLLGIVAGYFRVPVDRILIPLGHLPLAIPLMLPAL